MKLFASLGLKSGCFYGCPEEYQSSVRPFPRPVHVGARLVQRLNVLQSNSNANFCHFTLFPCLLAVVLCAFIPFNSPRAGHCNFTIDTMAPVTEDLHELVNKLEARVKQLEDKLHQATGGAPKPAVDSNGVRMILMGPPGAG